MAIDHGSSSAYAYLGKYYYTICNDKKKGLALVEKSMNLNSDRGYRIRLELYLHENDLASANKFLNVAREKKIARCFVTMAAYYDAKNMRNEELHYYLEGIKVDNRDVVLNTDIAWCYYQLEQYDKAMEWFKKVEFKLYNYEHYGRMAVCALAQDDMIEHKKYMKKAKEANCTKQYGLLINYYNQLD